jgi:hypothetical protein
MDFYQSTNAPKYEPVITGDRVSSQSVSTKATAVAQDNYKGFWNNPNQSSASGNGTSYVWLSDSGSAPYDVYIGVSDKVNSVQITFASGNTVTIDDPGADATWQEIQVCVNGSTKTIKVLSTSPI